MNTPNITNYFYCRPKNALIQLLIIYKLDNLSTGAEVRTSDLCPEKKQQNQEQ